MGSPRACTRIQGLKGYRVDRLEWEADGPWARVRIWIERRGIRGYECSGPPEVRARATVLLAVGVDRFDAERAGLAVFADCPVQLGSYFPLPVEAVPVDHVGAGARVRVRR